MGKESTFMEKKYEEEYSLLEIVKYNLKKWPILLVCALFFGVCAGGYGYTNTEPSVIYYEELQQVNGAFFVDEYNDTSINERMYDVQQVSLSHGAYEKFVEMTGYELTFKEFLNMFGYSNSIVTSVLNQYIAYPESYGNITVETEEAAIELMNQLMESQIAMFNEYMGEGAVTVLSAPYSSSFSQATAETATTTEDLIKATVKGGIAGVFLGLLLGIVLVSAVYLVGTVAKQAKEIEEKLKAPAVAFVHKNDRAEEFKKVTMFLEQSAGANETVCYVPFHEKNTDGAYDIAKAFAKMKQKTLYINLSLNVKQDEVSLSEYLFGKCKKEDISITTTEDSVDVVNRNISCENGQELLASRLLKTYIEEAKHNYERVIVNAPDLMKSSDAYGIAAYCDYVLVGCKRREVTGTDLYEINNTMKNNDIKVNGVVVYGN